MGCVRGTPIFPSPNDSHVPKNFIESFGMRHTKKFARIVSMVLIVKSINVNIVTWNGYRVALMVLIALISSLWSAHEWGNQQVSNHAPARLSALVMFGDTVFYLNKLLRWMLNHYFNQIQKFLK
eukprot:Gregarina_sp_Poly_1__4538@NODE_2436_length_2140_cov_43_605885_g1547_i0_p2_GENE_NODE_2436_length_2140_cov_43_605885_g1547_i0NODE_2436_length_2140_cov_43_605885_g1547_i0_p2_ORF_typecomplete_len124_score10_59Rho_RNA_bind/PF07497_12/0_02_NODE_2436_length_2140_cov_43_605885_g1547_i014601831